MKTSPRGQQFIKDREAFRSKAYLPTPDDVPTIGYGFTEGVKMGDVMSKTTADALFPSLLAPYERAVTAACTLEPNQNQFDAMVSLAFNIGAAAFTKSTVVRCHNRGDFTAAAKAFGLWNKQKGKVLAGLTSRRLLESVVYLEPVEGEEQHEVAQAVDPEPPFTASNINKGGLVAGGTAVVATAAETVNTVNAFKAGVDGLGQWLVPILLVVAVCAIGYIIWSRIQLRKSGQA